MAPGTSFRNFARAAFISACMAALYFARNLFRCAAAVGCAIMDNYYAAGVAVTRPAVSQYFKISGRAGLVREGVGGGYSIRLHTPPASTPDPAIRERLMFFLSRRLS